MEWAIFLQMLFEALIESIENWDRATVERKLNKPGIFIRWRLRQVLRDATDLRGRELGVEVDAGMAYLADMCSEEVKDLLDRAQASK